MTAKWQPHPTWIEEAKRVNAEADRKIVEACERLGQLTGRRTLGNVVKAVISDDKKALVKALTFSEDDSKKIRTVYREAVISRAVDYMLVELRNNASSDAHITKTMQALGYTVDSIKRFEVEPVKFTVVKIIK